MWEVIPEKDFTRKAAVTLEAALTHYGVPHDIKVYPLTRHGFFNAGRKVFAPETAADAWTRTLRFSASTWLATPDAEDTVRHLPREACGSSHARAVTGRDRTLLVRHCPGAESSDERAVGRWCSAS